MTIGLIVGICTLFFMVLHFTLTTSNNVYNSIKNKKTNQQQQLQTLQQQVADLTNALKNVSVSK